MSKSIKSTPISRNVRTKPKIEEKDANKLKKTPSKVVAGNSKTSTTATVTTTEKLKTKNEQKKILQKPSINKMASKVESKQENISRNISRIKPVAAKPKPAEVKNQPLRAKYAPEIIQNVKNANSRTITKANVMNTVHNVTVSSPPSKRKEILPETSSKIIEKPLVERTMRERTRTRTLEPEEVVVLKSNASGPKSLDTFLAGNSTRAVLKSEELQAHVKEPVAFEIKFKEKQKEEIKPRDTLKSESKQQKDSEGSEEGDYEDDFESYESDFETGSSSADASEAAAATPTDEDEKEEEDEAIKNIIKTNTADSSDTSDESEETQLPITVIHRDKEDERKLDSGNYDLRREKLQQLQVPQQFDSIDTTTVNSDQLDSGISYSGNMSQSGRSSASAGFTSFTKPTKISKRGRELMQKILLDTVGFTLFELKPIKYEHYMKIYGNFNARQATTQTNENRLNTECQTDEVQSRSIWTQHPPQYDLKFVQENNFINLRNACGEFSDDEDVAAAKKIHENNDCFAESIKALNKFKKNESKRVLMEVRKQINFDRLNDFLNKTVPAVMGVLSKSVKSKRLKSTRLSLSSGFSNLNANFLNALKVIRIFSNSHYNLVLTVHESIDEIYKSDFQNLISVWSTNEPENPIRLLSTWSEVCRVEICAESPDIIVCGLKDGSIAMWDLRETYSFCSKLDGYLKHFAATQSIAPSLSGADMALMDLGAVIDIKSFKVETKIFNFRTYKPRQFVSLNDTGILTVWTLIETGNMNFSTTTELPGTKNSNSKIEYSSPWARVKLTQSSICDLREYLELKHIRMQNKFEKTRSYFENDIFNDETLKELQENNQDFKLGQQGLRFTKLDTGVEAIFIATNRNFILSCSKTLKSNRFGKIIIDESKFLFATAMKLLGTEEFLIVGLSNGSVIALNCNQNKPNEIPFNNSEFAEKPPASSSSTNNEDLELEVGKSCAIQNIIRNERKSYEDFESTGLYELKQNSTFDTNFGGDLGEFEFRIFDQQVLLSGSVLRKSLVQNIEISNDGRKLYALTDGNIRVYDFLMEKAVHNSINGDIRGFGLVKETSGQQNLVLITKDLEVQIHNLK